ncbi:MAG: PrgI family protein, partial [Firmicutes bacterium]|nr:PrgI family protein [Bacillota bacterium]
MAYVNVPKDLTKVKSKVLFNLTKRQLVCFGMASRIYAPRVLTDLFTKL